MPLYFRSPTQLALVALVTVFVVFCLVSRSSFGTASLSTVLMDTQNDDNDDDGPPLAISLKAVHTTLVNQPCVLDVTVKNTNTDKHAGTLTVLNWNSPLDPKASLLGVFAVEDAETGKQDQTPTLMINRQRPPPLDDLVELAAQQEVTTQVTLTGIQLSADRTYSIRAVGRWMAVWNEPKDAVVADSKKMEQLSGATRGPFGSDSVVVKQSA